MSKSNDKRPKKKSSRPATFNARTGGVSTIPSGAPTSRVEVIGAGPGVGAGGLTSVDILYDSMTRRAQFADAVRQMLKALGEDPARPGLRDTPHRVAKAWLECWGAGYEKQSVEDLITLFPDVEYYDTQMVTVRDISFHSHCEHHLAAFSGRAHISYIPSKKGVIGLSKLARVTDYFSRKLQTQERLTNEIADFLDKHLSKHVAVKLEATHGCMVSRGVMQPNAVTVTTALRGDYKTDPSMRTEFYDAIGS